MLKYLFYLLIFILIVFGGLRLVNIPVKNTKKKTIKIERNMPVINKHGLQWQTLEEWYDKDNFHGKS